MEKQKHQNSETPKGVGVETEIINFLAEGEINVRKG